MNISLSPDLEAKLARLASEKGCAADALVIEAVERLVGYDEWLWREVEKGLDAAERGNLVDDDDAGKLIDERYPSWRKVGTNENSVAFLRVPSAHCG